MSAPQTRRSPGPTGLRDRTQNTSGCHCTTAQLPDNWRDRLPDPASYYGQHIAKLGKPNATGWAQGVCPLHDDHNKSLSVCITGERGGWRCFAGCGGGDLVGFHSRLRGLDFKAAVRDLIGGGR